MFTAVVGFEVDKIVGFDMENQQAPRGSLRADQSPRARNAVWRSWLPPLICLKTGFGHAERAMIQEVDGGIKVEQMLGGCLRRDWSCAKTSRAKYRIECARGSLHNPDEQVMAVRQVLRGMQCHRNRSPIVNSPSAWPPQ